MNRLPNVLKSRHGVYYLRTYRDGREVRTSLRTKEWATAKLLALHFHLGRAMPIRKLDVEFPSGFKISNVNTPDDFAFLKRLLPDDVVKRFLEESAAGTAAAQKQRGTAPEATADTPAKPAAPVAAPSAKTKPFSDVVALYLAEKKLDNTPKTLTEKLATYTEYQRLFGDVDISALGSEASVSFKSRMVADGANAPSINKKLSYMKDLFQYAINNKMYFAANPFDGLNCRRRLNFDPAGVRRNSWTGYAKSPRLLRYSFGLSAPSEILMRSVLYQRM